MFLCLNAIASMPFDPFLAKKCVPTVELDEKFPYSKKINTQNDLVQNAGKYFADKNKAIIYGRVLDEYCKPVSDAKLKLWQDITLDDRDMLSLSGMTNSNNIGEFIFITFLPENTKEKEIKAKLAVMHEEYYPHYVAINLTNKTSLNRQNLHVSSDWLNPNEPLSKYNQNNIYHVDIVLPIDKENIRF
jgi:hypothetical protein